MKKLFCLLFILSSFHLFVAAQPPAIEASFSRDSVMIGEQFDLSVRVEKDVMQVVDFPVLTGSELAPQVEILSESKVDTLVSESRRQVLTKSYLLTVWREGGYNMGRFPVLYLDKNRVDTLLTADSLRIIVSTYDIDLQTDSPVGIKRIKRLFGEWSGWLLLGVLGLIVIGAAVWLVRKFRHKIPFLAPREVLPPHVEAIRQLEVLRNQKLPQNGKLKLYYSGVTDILRQYISSRFAIGAMEMTSAEIVDALGDFRGNEIDAKHFADLDELLRTADMVKFARAQPSSDQADSDWYRAYYFVEETKLVAPAAE